MLLCCWRPSHHCSSPEPTALDDVASGFPACRACLSTEKTDNLHHAWLSIRASPHRRSCILPVASTPSSPTLSRCKTHNICIRHCFAFRWLQIGGSTDHMDASPASSRLIVTVLVFAGIKCGNRRRDQDATRVLTKMCNGKEPSSRKKKGMSTHTLYDGKRQSWNACCCRHRHFAQRMQNGAGPSA